MHRNTERGLAAGAMLCWLGVGVYGVWEIWGEREGDAWEWPYALSSISLLLAATLTLAVGWAATRDSEQRIVRRIGLGVGILAVASTLVAWAAPLWMTLIAAGFVVLALSVPRSARFPLLAIATAQLLGMAAMFVGIVAEVGRQNSYGDHPAAFGIGLVVTAVLSALGLVFAAPSALAAPDRSTPLVGRGAAATP